MSAIELKPCPFCGGEASHAVGETGEGKPWHYTECETCGAFGPQVPYADHNIAVLKANAEAWNTRSDLIPAMLAEARREALREARDNISGSCWAMPSNGGTRSYNRGVQDSLSVIDALLDAEAPAQPKPDAVQEATAMDSELDRLIEKWRARGPMTKAEVRAQKISFIYGQLMNAAPNITKEEIARVLDKMEGHDDD